MLHVITGKTYTVEKASVAATVSLHPESITVIGDEAFCPATCVLSVSFEDKSEASPLFPARFSLCSFSNQISWELLTKEEGAFAIDPYDSLDVYGVDISLAAESAIASACVKAEYAAWGLLRDALDGKRAAA